MINETLCSPTLTLFITVMLTVVIINRGTVYLMTTQYDYTRGVLYFVHFMCINTTLHDYTTSVVRSKKLNFAVFIHLRLPLKYKTFYQIVELGDFCGGAYIYSPVQRDLVHFEPTIQDHKITAAEVYHRNLVLLLKVYKVACQG